MARIVYNDLYDVDPTEAMHKLLQEAVLPLFTWSQGHEKRGATDILVIEGRILLLMQTYAINLWKVFLFYAVDQSGRIPNLDLRFPSVVQQSEKMMFGCPPSLPPLPVSEGEEMNAYIMSVGAFVKFCEDYELIPTLMSRRDVGMRARAIAEVNNQFSDLLSYICNT